MYEYTEAEWKTSFITQELPKIYVNNNPDDQKLISNKKKLKKRG